MDLSFFRRAERVFARRSAAPLDYRVLVATLEALQSASPAARSIRSAHERADLAPSHDRSPSCCSAGRPGAMRLGRKAAASTAAR
jgi:hypothetical protein